MSEKFVFVGTHSQFNEAIEKLTPVEDFNKDQEIEEGHFVFEVTVKRSDATEAVAAPKSVKSK